MLQILGNQNRIIENFIRDSDTVIGELNDNRRDVVRFVREAGDTAEISATPPAGDPRGPPPPADTPRRAAADDGAARGADRRPEPAARRPARAPARPDHLLHAPRPVLAGLATRPRLARRGVAGPARGPSARAPRRSGSSRTSRPRPSPRSSRCVSSCRRWTTAGAQSTATTTRAATGGLPRPIPTHIGSGDKQGWTGLESIWNYPFWQGQSINGYDDIGHLLRVSIYARPDCADAADRARAERDPQDKRVFDKCSQWLGPEPAGHQRAGLHHRPRARSPGCERESRAAGRPAWASAGSRASPRRGRCRASATSPSRRSRCRRACRELIDDLAPQRGRRPRAPSAPAGRQRQRPDHAARAYSTSSWAHDATTRDSLPRREPGPGRGGDRADHDHRGLHRLQRQPRAAVRPDLRPERRAARRAASS